MQLLDFTLDYGIPRWLGDKECTYQCRRREFDPWVRKIPWRRAWPPTPALLPGESPWTEEPGGLQSMGSQSLTGLSDQGRTRDLCTAFRAPAGITSTAGCWAAWAATSAALPDCFHGTDWDPPSLGWRLGSYFVCVSLVDCHDLALQMVL